MKKNYKLPILLLAVVVMLSIFYIKEANTSEVEDTLANSDLIEVSTLNPDFTEARLQSISEVETKVDALEAKIASGELEASEVEEANIEIDNLILTKNNEIALEEEILALYDNFLDVLVLLNDDSIDVSIYDDEELNSSDFIAISRLSYQIFSSDYKVVVSLISSLE